ncbi:hypothetical protein M23134_06894 [Microscilla marina ATCC 23134]|uniref:Uncharacterized protein n=1 Tax=Microscilla marina ATCC 23134 TaxID=313606 RepID=A1ZQ84_MICM2|nr:hypothetical protein M23134_06894 [Microscilla marina ATCC 23134]
MIQKSKKKTTVKIPLLVKPVLVAYALLLRVVSDLFITLQRK